MFFRLFTLTLLTITFNSQASKLKLATLSPHLTELVYSAGAGNQLVGVSGYSNFPEQAKLLPVIGDAFSINQELLLTLKPDIVFYWYGNIAKQMVAQVENLGIKAIPIKTQNIQDIPNAIDQIAGMADTTPHNDVNTFVSRIKELREQSTQKTEQSALIQISSRPIYTVNSDHWMSESLQICGLGNVFSDLPLQSSSVNIESIIEKNPDVLIRFSPLKPQDNLSQFKQINAVKNNRVIVVNPDHYSRPTLRLLHAIENICSSTKKTDP